MGYTSATATWGVPSGVTLLTLSTVTPLTVSSTLLLGTSGATGSASVSQGAFIPGATASSTPVAGGSITATANTDSYGVLGSSTLSTLTFTLPPLTGSIGQSFLIDFLPAVTTLTIKNSAGITLATTSASALGPKRFKSFDGTSWTMVQ